MNELEKNSGGIPWTQCAGILLAAVVLGLLYNHASPLRVRAMTETSATSDSTNAPKLRGTVRNETISLSFDNPTTVSAPPPAPPSGNSPAVNLPALRWPEVKALLDAGKIVLLDARAKASYDSGHIPGAISLPAATPANDLRTFTERFQKTTALVTYCGADDCRLSHALAEMLVKVCGFTNVSEMPGGFAEYNLATSAPK